MGHRRFPCQHRRPFLRAAALVFVWLLLAACRQGPAPLQQTIPSTPTFESEPASIALAPTETSTPTATATATATETTTATTTPTETPTLVPLPRVVASYPIEGDRAVPRDAAIVITLSGDADRARVEATFAFSPTLAGEASWLDARRVRFQPRELAAGRAYRLRFSLHRRERALDSGEVFTATFESGAGGVTIPILMYHHLRELEPEASKAEREWAVSPAQFERQLAYLSEKGYHSIDFAQMLAYIKNREPLPPRPAIISFDDGYHSFYAVGAPLLKKHGFTASILALPGNVDYPAYLSWAEMIELRQAGHYFGSHTLNHPNLTKLKPEEAKKQLVDSKALLEAKLGQPVNVFCYPLGSYNNEIVGWLKEAGYEAACSLDLGYIQRAENDGLYHLRRIWVGYPTTLEDFARRLPW